MINRDFASRPAESKQARPGLLERVGFREDWSPLDQPKVGTAKDLNEKKEKVHMQCARVWHDGGAYKSNLTSILMRVLSIVTHILSARQVANTCGANKSI